MIYNSLDILPVTVFFKIVETKDVSHLVKDKPWYWKTKIHPAVGKLFKSYNQENLIEVWESLYEEFKTLDPNDKSAHLIELYSKMDHLSYKYSSIKLSIKCLRNVKDPELIKLIQDFRYQLRDESFNEDLNAIDKQVESLLFKIERYKKQLPKSTEKQNVSVYDIIASYSLILGFNIDANKVTVREFFAIQNQVKKKIKLLEENGRQGNNKR